VVWGLEQAGVHPLLARLFAGRGIRAADELDDGLGLLLTPACLHGATAGGEVPRRRHRGGQTALRRRRLRLRRRDACAVGAARPGLLGAAPASLAYVVPDRAVHGYGLTPTIVDLGLQHQPTVLVTSTTASPAWKAWPYAGPAASASSSPTTPAGPDRGSDRLAGRRRDRQSEPAGCGFTSKNLRGVGVVFYVLLALRSELRERGVLHGTRRSRASTPFSIWSPSAPSPTWSGSTPTTGAWSRRAEAGPRRPHAGRGCRTLRAAGRDPGAPALSTSASPSARASMPPAASPT
jgi:single-stranded-DNA-specific exonuclease